MVHPDKREPLYLTISNRLIEEIGYGRYPVGSNLPTELELAATLGVSRATITAAFGQLERLGLVYRRARVGTQVVSRFPIRSHVTDGGMFQDWARYGTEYVFEVLTKGYEAVPPPANYKGRARDRRPWLLLRGIRRSAGTALSICVTTVYVHPDYAAIDADITSRPPRIFSLIEGRFGLLVHSVEQELRGTIIQPTDALELDVAPGSVGLEINRRYIGPAGKLVEFTVDIHRADRFTYKTIMRRGP